MLSLSCDVNLNNLPVAFIERYRVADGPAIKVAIYIMLGNTPDASLIADELSLPLTTVERTLNYWRKAGLLIEEDTVSSNEGSVKKPQIEIKRLSDDELKLLLRNPEIELLAQETQNLLGRVITPSEAARLVAIYHYDELPIEVILMIIAFSIPRVKRNLFTYIERVARNWKEDEIDTIGKAEKYLMLLERRQQQYILTAEVFGVKDSSFTYKEREYINSWFEEYGFDSVFIDEAAQKLVKKTVSSVNRILRQWSEKGYTTIKETRSELSNTAAPISQRSSNNSNDTSLYEIALRKATSKKKTTGT